MSQVLPCLWLMDRLGEQVSRSYFRTSSHTYCEKQSPQQIESVVSFSYFSRCHYQKFYVNTYFIPWGMLIWDQNYKTLKTKFPFLLVFSVCYWEHAIGEQRCSNPAKAFLLFCLQNHRNVVLIFSSSMQFNSVNIYSLPSLGQVLGPCCERKYGRY